MRTAGVISLGCSKNRVDSENMLGMLRQRGYTIVNDPEQAELIIVNTCGFIEPAKEESIETIFEMAQYKQSGRLKLLLVTGCLSQRYGRELKEEMPEVDAFMGVAEYSRLFEIIDQAERGERPLAMGEGERFCLGPRVLTTPAYSAYVKISDGCDNRCSYCAIPLIRGRYHSRPMEDILRECEDLARNGVSEITLIAQDTSRYGNDFEGHRLLLPELLEKVSGIEGVHWIRVLYCYPDTVNETLLDAIERLPKVCKYMDLPLQHIDGKLLKEMNRRGSPEYIRELIQSCHRRGISVRTTMIVGFPGETDEQFETLERFIQEARFDRMGAFTYSAEEGTPAAGRSDQIPEEVKQSRLDRLMTLQQRISLEANQARVGEVAEVLVEGYDQGRYYGRSRMEAPEIDGKIWFKSQKELKPGEYVFVKIMEAYEYDLSGEAMV